MRAALVGAGVTRDAGVAYADELRLGLRGQVRRVLARRGVDVTQRLQLKYEWAYLLLAVDPRAGTLRWRWLDRPRAAPIRETLAAWALDAVPDDGAGAHRARLLADLPTARIRPVPPQPPEHRPLADPRQPPGLRHPPPAPHQPERTQPLPLPHVTLSPVPQLQLLRRLLPCHRHAATHRPASSGRPAQLSCQLQSESV
jgi:hypothetical protein